jgi:hypothetical protein
MTEFWYALLVLVLLCVAAAAGFLLRERLSENHLSEGSMQAVRMVATLLITFAALVLSLLLASVRGSYETALRDRGFYAAELVRLDQCLRDYGVSTERARSKLHAYTAAVIASTWPHEPRPTGVEYPNPEQMPLVGEDQTLASLMASIGLEIYALAPSDPLHAALAAHCRAQYEAVQTRRWTVIEEAHGSLSGPFPIILTFWLMVVFVSFGLQAPRNMLTALTIAIGAVSISSVMFVIFDLDLPYGGLFGIPSTSMRNALADMLR